MKIMLKKRHLTGALRVFAALLVIASLFLAFFHFHEHAEDHGDCQVCRLVQFISGVLVLWVSAILIQAPQGRKFQPVLETKFFSLLSASSLKDRAPPAFSF